MQTKRVVVVPYDEAWKAAFEEIKNEIEAVIGDLIGTFVNAAPNKKLLNYSYFEQWKDIMPAMALSIVMMVIVRMVGLLALAPLPLLVLEVFVGAAVYILGSALFKLESFHYLLNQIRKK